MSVILVLVSIMPLVPILPPLSTALADLDFMEGDVNLRKMSVNPILASIPLVLIR